MTGPVIDQIRAASLIGLETLAIQIGALADAFKERSKPAERRKLSAAPDYLTRRLALWCELLSDEPELVARLEGLAEQMRALRTRRGGSRSRERCASAHGPHTKEAR